MRPTPRGWKLITVAAILSAYSILISDFLVAAIAVALIAVIAAALMSFLLRLGNVREAKVTPPELDVRVKAGEVGELFFKMYSGVPITIRLDERWLSCRPERLEPPENLLKILVSSPRSGVYELDHLGVIVSDFLGVFEAYVKVPLRLRARVYPRVLPWIMEAVRLIGEAATGLGEAPGKRKGRGLEYLWSREYQPGDPFVLVDWKATARLRKIIIKEFLEEGYGSVKIVYDLRAHGSVSRDECSAYFLSAVVSSARAGMPMDLTIKNGDEVLVNRENLDPVEALKTALAYVLESCITDSWDLYEFFEPKSARILMEISRELGSRGSREIAELKLENMLKRLRAIMEKSKAFVIYVGCVLIDSVLVMELGSEVAKANGKFLVLTPLKPWVDAENLEEAYLMYQSHWKTLNALRKLGAEISCGDKARALTT